MWYEGVSVDNIHSIGVASSFDGVNWERLSTDPVFTPSSDPEAWDGGGVGSPYLVWLNDRKRWRMYYVGTELNNSDVITLCSDLPDLHNTELNFPAVKSLRELVDSGSIAIDVVSS